MSAASNDTQTALKIFTGFKSQADLVSIYLEAKNDFTPSELSEYTATFVKFEVNKSGDLDEFAIECLKRGM